MGLMMTDRLLKALNAGDQRARDLRAAASEEDARRDLQGDTVFLDKGPSLPSVIRSRMDSPVIRGHAQTRW